MNISCVKQLFDAGQNNSCCMLSMQVPPRGLRDRPIAIIDEPCSCCDGVTQDMGLE